MSMNSSKTPGSTGRPREFDVDQALDQALRVFWEKGYEGASMADLTAAMGINRPSLYSAFGNKESLFLKALARYEEGPAAYVKQALEEPTARAVAEKILFGATEVLGDPTNPRGCLAIQGALSCGDEAKAVKDQLVSLRCEFMDAVEERFERAKQEGELDAGVDVRQLARYIVTVAQGLSIQASSGTCAAGLRDIAEQAMKAWPA